MSHRYFDAHETRLCFGTRTDVLLLEVRPHALRFLRALDAKGLRNAVALITKLEVSDDFCERIKDLKHIRVVFLASWSAMPSGVEKGVRRRCARNDASTLCSRPAGDPLLQATGSSNTDEETLHVFCRQWRAARCARSTWASSSPNLAGFYRADLYSAGARNGEEYGTRLAGCGLEAQGIAAERWPDYPVRRTYVPWPMCSVSRTTRQRTATRSFACSLPRPSARACSTARRMPSVAEAEVALHRIGLPNRVVVTDDAIHIDGEVSQEDYSISSTPSAFHFRERQVLPRVPGGHLHSQPVERRPRSVCGLVIVLASTSGMPTAHRGHSSGGQTAGAGTDMRDRTGGIGAHALTAGLRSGPRSPRYRPAVVVRARAWPSGVCAHWTGCRPPAPPDSWVLPAALGSEQRLPSFPDVPGTQHRSPDVGRQPKPRSCLPSRGLRSRRGPGDAPGWPGPEKGDLRLKGAEEQQTCPRTPRCDARPEPGSVHALWIRSPRRPIGSIAPCPESRRVHLATRP